MSENVYVILYRLMTILRIYVKTPVGTLEIIPCVGGNVIISLGHTSNALLENIENDRLGMFSDFYVW